MKKIYLITYLLALVVFGYAQDTLIYDNTVTINSDLSDYENVEVVGVEGITFAAGFEYSSNGNGELTTDGDPMGVEVPQGFAPFADIELDSSGSSGTTLDYNLVPGTIKGGAGVSGSGAATYSIPISVPKGNNGMEPQLSINYSSQSGFGILGKGWDLSGLSSITTRGRNLYQDNVYAYMTSDDTTACVYWDGMRLFGYNDKGLAADSFYTESYSNTKIKRNGLMYSSEFLINTEDGITMVYGDDNKLVLSPYIEWEWPIEKRYDRYGNAINYTYQNSDNFQYIEKIEYGGESNTPINTLEIHYKEIQSPEYSFFLGNKILQNKIIDSISVSSNGQFYCAYGFNYDESNEESYLSEITKYDKDYNIYNSTKIEWEHPSANMTTSEVTASIISGNTFKYFTGDFTGDGYSDIVSVNMDFYGNNVDYYLYKGSATGIGSTYNESGEFAYSYTRQFWNVLHDTYENGCNASAYDIYNVPDIRDIMAGDFDGDGIDELFVYAVEWDVLGENLPEDLTPGFETGFIYNFLSNVINICNYSTEMQAPVTMAPNYGIGRFINFDEQIGSTNRIESFHIGDGASYELNNTSLPDIMGFGYNALLHGNKVKYYNISTNELEEYVIIEGSDLYFGEFTGDGLTDYIYKDNDVKLMKYAPFFKEFELVNTGNDSIKNHPIGIIDINGDGVSGWVGYEDEEFANMLISDLWDDFDDGTKNISVNADWNAFLSLYDLGSDYNDYVNGPLCFSDNTICRSMYVDIERANISLGYDLYINHAPNCGLKVELGKLLTDEIGAVRAASSDIDADGRNDLLLFSDDNLFKIFYEFIPEYDASGDIVYTWTELNVDYDLGNNVQIGDFNGDGIVDFICPENDKLLSFVTNDISATRIKSVVNGLGNKTCYYYSRMTDPLVYTKGNEANYPLMDLITPWSIVQSVARDNGIAQRDSISYQYEGGQVHMQGKGSMGFSKRIISNHLTNSKSIFNTKIDTLFYIPLADSSMRFIGDTLIYSSLAYQSIIPIGTRQFRIQADSSVTFDALNGVSKNSSRKYNSLGQVIESKTEVNNIASVKQKFEYTNGGWYFPYLPSKTVSSIRRGSRTVSDSSSFRYDSDGRLIEERSLLGTDREIVSRYRDFNSFGSPRELSVVAKSGLSLELDSTLQKIEYSDCGRFPESVSGALGSKKYFEYDQITGLLRKQFTPNELEVSYEYGEFFSPQKTILADNKQQISKLYWAKGHEDAPEGSLYMTFSIASGVSESISFYDSKGRILRTVSRDFNDDKLYIDIEYDNKGRPWNKSMPYISSGTPKWTVMSYDHLGRLVSQAAPDSTTTSIEYGALWTETTVAKGSVSQSSKSTVNALGEVIQSEDNSGNIVYSLYYPDGKLKATSTSVNPSDSVKIEYDVMGNRTKIDDPDAGTVESSYDGFGRQVLQVNAKGDTTSFVYDELGRVLQSTDNRGDINYVYINDSSSVAFGKIDSVYNSGAALSTSFSYDSDYGRLVSKTNRQLGKKYTDSYTYDWYGRPLSRNYPSGFELQYSYTENGAMEEIRGNGTSIWSCNDVNELGQVTSYSQGIYNTTVDYDPYGVLEEVSTGSIYNMKYGFDDAGNMEFREDVRTNQKEMFSYDDLNRLTGIDYYLNSNHVSSADLDLSFSDDGNITSKTDVASTINYGENGTGPHAISSIDSPVSTYSPPPQQIDYNCFNKVELIQDTIGVDTTLSLSFSYGLGNQRIRTRFSNNGTIEKTKFYNGDYEEDSTSLGVKKYHYISSPTGLTAIFVMQGTNNDTMYHVLTDHLGSITGVVNEESDEVDYFSYSAWGISRDASDWTSGFDGELFADRGYTGHEHLEEFGLINMNGRVYDPVLARFLSPDPFVQFPQYASSYNRYGYVFNNPMIYIDPSGYFKENSNFKKWWQWVTGDSPYWVDNKGRIRRGSGGDNGGSSGGYSSFYFSYGSGTSGGAYSRRGNAMGGGSSGGGRGPQLLTQNIITERERDIDMWVPMKYNVTPDLEFNWEGDRPDQVDLDEDPFLQILEWYKYLKKVDFENPRNETEGKYQLRDIVDYSTKRLSSGHWFSGGEYRSKSNGKRYRFTFTKGGKESVYKARGTYRIIDYKRYEGENKYVYHFGFTEEVNCYSISLINFTGYEIITISFSNFDVYKYYYNLYND